MTPACPVFPVAQGHAVREEQRGTTFILPKRSFCVIIEPPASRRTFLLKERIARGRSASALQVWREAGKGMEHMKNVGIICEFDPFTEGHGYLFRELRRLGAERLICLMSGCFVQRGGPALLPPLYRAEAALRCGADAVFELPFPFSSLGAGYFAGAGVSVLARLGADTVAFGSECGDIGKLAALAASPAPERGPGSPSGGTAEIWLGERGRGPNDILAVEYLRALRKLPEETRPGAVAVKRKGSGHGETALPGRKVDTLPGEYPSASEIRRAVLEGRDPSELRIPADSAAAVKSATADGRCPVPPDAAGEFMLRAWRMTPAEDAGSYAECGGGLGERLRMASLEARSFAGFTELASTKKYTSSRIRRAMLLGAMRIPSSAACMTPAYARLLAAGPEGRRFIGEAAGRDIAVVTRTSDIPDTPGARLQRICDERAAALYSLLMPRPASASELLTPHPYIFE